MLVVILVDWLISQEFAVSEFSRFVCHSEWRIRFLTEKKRNGKLSKILPEYVAPMCVSFFDHNFFSSKVYMTLRFFFPICVETKLRTHKLSTSVLDGNTC